jgi:TP901 family phage tail tape measure protein
MAEYTLSIIVQGIDQTAPAQEGMARFGAAGNVMGAAITGAMLAAGAAVVGFVGASVNAAGDFQQNMNMLQAASGATAAQMATLGQTAMALGNDMTLPGASASDAATAMLELSKAGLTVDQTMAAAKGTLQLAAAAETDAATAAQVVAGALNAFGLEGTAATQIADQLAAGANASAASITDLSQGFQAAGFAFNATGQKTDDLVSALAMLTNVGLTGSDAGTALKNAMMQLMAPTDGAAKTMAQYGINVRDAQGNMLPFRDIIGALQTGLGGLNAAQQESALKTILQGDGMKAMIPLLSAGVAGFDAMKVKVNEAGAAQKMAEAQMQGFNGALAGVGNAVETLQLALGSALIPVLTILLNAVSPLINNITTFTQALFGSAEAFASLGPIAQVAVAGLQMLGEMFSALAGEAVAWGANIIGSLADGMMGAADAVIGILNMIGGMIADLLMPGSPPKLLPGLTDWGAGGIQAYMDGWSQADMSVFNGIGDAIKSSLEGIAKASGDKGMNVAGMVLGSQGQIATAINEIHTLGSVSEATFNSIIDAAGPAGPQIAGIMNAYFDLEAATQNVAAAQEELNSVTAQYAAQIDPLKAQLKGIQDQKAAIQDQEKLAKLYTTVADTSISESARQVAQLEIQELQTKGQIRTAEAERDSAVGAAKAKLDAAKEQQSAAKAAVDSQKALIDVQNKGNALVAQQTQAMAGAAGAMRGAGGAMAGMAQATAPLSAAVSSVGTAVQTVKGTVQAAQATVQATGETFASVAAMIQGVFAPAVAFVQANLAAFQGALMGVGIALAGVFVALVAWPAVMGVIGAVVGVVGAALAFLLSPIGLLIIGAAALGAAINTNFMGIGTLFAGLSPIFTAILAVIGQVITAFGVGGLAGALTALQAGLAVVGPMLMAWGAQLGTVLLGIGQLILTNVLTWGAAFISWIAPYVPIVLAALGSLALSIGGWIVAQAPALIAQFMAWGMAFVNWISPAIESMIIQLGALAVGIYNWIAAQAAPILVQLQTWAAALVAWIVPATISFLAAWPGMLSGFLAWIAAAAGPILVQLGNWAISFVAWVLPMVPTLLVALGGIVIALGTFIAETALVLVGALAGWALAFVGWIATSAIPGLLAGLVGFGATILAWIGSAVMWLGSEALRLGASLVSGILSSISAGWGAIESAVLANTTTIRTIIQAVWNTIVLVTSAAWNAIAGIVGPAIAQVVSVLAPGVTFIQNAWTVGLAVVVGATTAAWVTIQTAIQAAITTVQGAIQAVISFIQSVWGGAQTAAQTQTAGAWTAIQTLITGAMLAVRIAIEAGVAVVKTIMSTAWAVVVAAAQNDFGKIPAIISAGWAQIKTIMGAGVSAITAIAGVMAAAATALGKNIVSGIISGVSSMGNALGDKLKSLAKSALDAAKGALGIHSPSSVMAAQVGVQIPAGIAQGITQATPKAQTAMIDMAGKLVGLVSNAVGAFGQLANIGEIPQGAVERFSTSMFTVIDMLNLVNQATRGQMMGSAMQITGGANKVLETIVKGVDGFAKLATMGAVPESAMTLFAAALLRVVTVLDEVNVATRGKMMASAMQVTGGAEKVIDMVSKGADAFAKLATMGDVPAAGVHAFGVAIGAAIGELQQVALTYAGAGLSFTAVFAENAGKIVALIGPAVEGLNKLSGLANPIPGSFARFATYISAFVQRIAEVAGQIAGGAVSLAATFADGAGKVLAILGSGVDGLTKLGTLGAPVPGMFQAFATQIFALVLRMAEVANWIAKDATAKAAAFAESAGKVIGIIGTGVEAFKKLAGFERVAPEAISAFALSLSDVMTALYYMAGQFTADGIAAASTFAETAGKVVGILATGVDGFKKIADFERVAPEALTAFALSLSDAISAIYYMAGQFSSEGIAAAGVFADSAGKILGMIGNGVAGLMKLSTFVAPSWASMTAFRDSIQKWSIAMIQLATMFEGYPVESAVAFADAAGKIIGMVGSGVDGLTKLNTFVAPAWSSMVAFRDSIQKWSIAMIQLATMFEGYPVEAAVAFAESAGKILGVLTAGVDGLTKLQDLGPVSQIGMSAFAAAINQLMSQMIAMAEGFSDGALATAGKFASAANTTVGILKDGVEGFQLVSVFTGVSQDAIDRFAAGVQMAVASMARMAAVFGTDATSAAMAFAKAAGESTDFLKKGVDGFNKLSEQETIPQSAMDSFAKNVIGLINTITYLSGVLTTETMLRANAFANAIDSVITVIKSGLDALSNLSTQSSLIGNYAGAIVAQVNLLGDILAKQARPAANNIGYNISLGIAEGIISGAGAIQNAIFAAVNAALAAARAALGIASPSKVFHDQIGLQMSAGMAEGVLGGMGGVQAAVGQVSSGALGGVGGGATTNNQSSVNITFAPGSIVGGPGQNVDDIAKAVARQIQIEIGGRLA